MSLKQFENLSTWREDKVTVKGGEIYTLTFIDTRPNMFYIQNPNNARLYVSISKIPRANSYEFMVDANSSATLGRPTPTGYLYIYNEGGLDADITVYSIKDIFDLNILKNISVSADGASFQSDGIVRGFGEGVSVPSGTNHIGTITVENENFADLLNALNNVKNTGDATNAKLVDIFNKFGNIEGYTSLFQILEYVMNHLREIKVNTAPSVPANATPVYLNNADAFSYTATEDCKVRFSWFFNDSADLAHFKIGENYLLSVFSGEQFGDFELDVKAGETLELECETPIFRAKYWVI